MKNVLTMKKKLLFAMLMGGSPLLFANSQADVQDALWQSATSADVFVIEGQAQSPLQDSQKVQAFLKSFYNKYLFETLKADMTFEKAVQTYCTKSLQKYLSEQYEYECPDNACYERSCFLSGAQDGPSEESKLIRIESKGNDWYMVVFMDMGNIANTYIHCVVEGGKLKMDKVTRSSRDINANSGFLIY